MLHVLLGMAQRWARASGTNGLSGSPMSTLFGGMGIHSSASVLRAYHTPSTFFACTGKQSLPLQQDTLRLSGIIHLEYILWCNSMCSGGCCANAGVTRANRIR